MTVFSIALPRTPTINLPGSDLRDTDPGYLSTSKSYTSASAWAVNIQADLKRRLRYCACALLMGFSLSTFAVDIGIESSIMFNTSCARCHEGQCSGRMSFQGSNASTDEHVRRHGGELPEKSIRELYELLRYMKQECSYYPVPVNTPGNHRWNKNALDQLIATSGQAYFIPVGTLLPGTYRIQLQGLDESLKIYLEVINGDFEFVLEEIVDANSGRQGLLMEANSKNDYYIRLKSAEPFSLNSLELSQQL